ncbi:N-acetyltaurine hydrolase isoform X2 [Phyllobates terribilis]|uniref:N-acetyltaurine hydrolase isoform X2 n=1 Tax=Phyllobates terribilis TaxID=111132 RepID=UPI003CCB04BE
MSSLSGRIQTVLGSIPTDQLGKTLTHEHLTMTFECCYYPPPAFQANLADGPIVMKNLFWLKQNPYSHRENLLLNQEVDAVKEELIAFKAAGGGCIVENTTTGISRDLTEVLVDEVLRGADGTDIKCGIIGEIGCSWPLTDSEKKILRATAEAQTQLGCPVNIHPGRNSEAPFQIVRILQEAGADVSKTVMSHLDRTIFDENILLEFAALGSYLEYDLFGTEMLNYQFNTAVDMPSDNDRIRAIRSLINEGYDEHIVISHDIHTKNRLVKYGGHGYSHIFNNIVPKMLLRGISQQNIDKILLENPRRWLTFK